MDQSVRIGQAFRDDHLVADEVEFIEQAELRTTEVPVAGGGGSVVRQRVIRGPTMIRFPSITDEVFRSDLDRRCVEVRAIRRMWDLPRSPGLSAVTWRRVWA
jgi:hypothetical protein